MKVKIVSEHKVCFADLREGDGFVSDDGTVCLKVPALSSDDNAFGFPQGGMPDTRCFFGHTLVTPAEITIVASPRSLP